VSWLKLPHVSPEHETSLAAGPAADGRLDPIVLNVAAGRNDQNLGRNGIERERLGTSGQRGLIQLGAGCTPALSQNRVGEDLQLGGARFGAGFRLNALVSLLFNASWSKLAGGLAPRAG
jgi:hypothetical protein